MNPLLSQFPELKTKDGQQATKLLFKILTNIIQHPNDTKYHDLNALKISKKFEKCKVCLHVLTVVGFNESTVNGQRRLIWNQSYLSITKQIHSGIQNFLSQLEQQQNTTNDNQYANKIINATIKPILTLSVKDRSQMIKTMQNIIQNPDNNVYTNIHLSSFRDGLENPDACVGVLRGMGFHTTILHNQQRLVMDNKNKDYYINSLMKLVVNAVTEMQDELDIKQHPKQQFIESCVGDIESCTSIERMIKYLNDYDIKENKLFNRENVPFLHDDFNHILMKHLGDDKENIKANKEFELIYEYIIKHVKQCEFGTCSKFGRNQRDTQKNRNTMDTHSGYYVDEMDMIHCFMMHTYDCGFRLRINEISEEKSYYNDEELHVDTQMIELKNVLQERRKKLESIRGSERIQNSKFVTNVDAKTVIDDDKKENESEGRGEYSFGHFYQYWSKEIDNLKHDEIRFGHYVAAKYSNLKEELLQNMIHKIDMDVFNKIKLKARIKLKESDFAKTLIAGSGNDETKHSFEYDLYKIPIGSTITQKHIMAVLLYTDLDELSYDFSITFRSINDGENINICKKRNAEYANWSKLLCETVNLFGQNIKHNAIYYHGLNCLLMFPSFLTIFYGPTSTSMQLSVAAMFAAETGVIVELGFEGGLLKSFDCRWLSRFANEDERLFIAPLISSDNMRLRFTNIRYCAVEQSYKYYIHSLTHFHFVVDGDCSPNHLVSDQDPMIISKLLDHYDESKKDKNNFPKYINDLFDVFVSDKKLIFINYHYFGDNTRTHVYTKFKQFFCYNGTDSIKINYICNIFKNCKEIKTKKKWVNNTTGNINLDSLYFNKMLLELDLLNQNKHNTLKRIELRDIKYELKLFDEMKSKFIAKKWNIAEKTQQQNGAKYIVISKT